MENKRTLLFVVIAAVIIGGSMLLQNLFAPPAPPPVATVAPVAVQPATQPTAEVKTFAPIPVDSSASAPKAEAGKVAKADVGKTAATATVAPLAPPEKVTIKTDLVEAILTNQGGDLESFILLQHKDSGVPVQMVLPGKDGSHAFELAFGRRGAAPLRDRFDVARDGDYAVTFSKPYAMPNADGTPGAPFLLKKTYRFIPGEYLFELDIGVVNQGKDVLMLSTEDIAYTMDVGPGIGPVFAKMSAQYEFRHFYAWTGSERRTIDPAKNDFPQDVSWTGIGGKYFSLVIKPANPASRLIWNFTSGNPVGGDFPSTVSMMRPALNGPVGSTSEDKYYVYLGPKTAQEMAKYNDPAQNALKLENAKIDEMVEAGRDWLGWLENGLKFFLMLFVGLIPNYGVAIILLTILTRMILFPLTWKSSVSTSKMQALKPETDELRAKYKDDPKRLNMEMAELYKKAGANPLTGCLPMLLQLPIFFAMYSLFSNHFDLRGAMFIPGWVPDLSVGDSIFHFQTVNLQIFSISDVRLLPIIYLFSQLFYGKFAQAPDTSGSAKNMKIFTMLLPIVFFFILYDAPSGLVLYWTASNALTIVQQLVINDRLKKRKAVAPAPTIAFPGKGKGKKR